MNERYIYKIRDYVFEFTKYNKDKTVKEGMEFGAGVMSNLIVFYDSYCNNEDMMVEFLFEAPIHKGNIFNGDPNSFMEDMWKNVLVAYEPICVSQLFKEISVLLDTLEGDVCLPEIKNIEKYRIYPKSFIALKNER